MNTTTTTERTTAMTTDRIFDTGAAGYGTFNLADFEQFEILPGRFLSAPEIVESLMSNRIQQVGGAISRNDGSYYAMIKDAEALIGREFTTDEFRVACVMAGKVRSGR